MLHLLRKNKELQKELREWKDQAKCYERLCQMSKETIKELQEHIDKIEKGERCEGDFCETCKHAINGTTIELFTIDNRLLKTGAGKTICALSVPCPDFQRKEE